MRQILLFPFLLLAGLLAAQSVPDAVVLIKDLQCVNGQLQLTYNVSNLGDKTLSGGFSISLYDADPTTGPANRLGTFVAQNAPLDPGLDENLSVAVDSFLAGFNAGDSVVVYAVINDAGLLTIPFLLDSLEYVGLPELLYTDNLHSNTFLLPFCAPLLPDAVVVLEALSCVNGELKLQYNVSNLGDTTLSPGYPISIYDADPTAGPANLLVTFNAENDTLAPGLDTTLYVPDNTFLSAFPQGSTFTLYAVINDNGTLPTPFDLDSLALNGLPDLLFSDNLDSGAYTIASPLPLDLGPDLITCSDTAIVLDAGAGYLSYLWQDSSTNAVFVADSMGLFWVEVTDSCGFKQRDSIMITYSLLNDTQLPDSTVCLGDSISYNIPGFDTYLWSPAAGLSCTDCPNVVISPDTTTTYTLEATSLIGCVLNDTFTVTVAPWPTTLDSFGICTGDTIEINGKVFTNAGTYTDTIPASVGCDTLATYVIKLLNDETSVASIICPANITVDAAPGATQAPVDFVKPDGTSDCPCPGLTMTQTEGPTSGSNFPIGNTAVCFEVVDACGDAAACCFVVRVNGTPAPQGDPCDVKTNKCMKYELLRITKDVKGDKTYHFRVTNFCATPVLYTAFQVPDGVQALAPANNSVFLTPNGNSYVVRNPNYSPLYSVRFKPLGAGLANGQSDEFSYTLPEQSNPAYINVVSRLSPSTWVEGHLNTFNCPVQSLKPDPGGPIFSGNTTMAPGLVVSPNPNDGNMTVSWEGDWDDSAVQLSLLNTQGNSIWERNAVQPGQTLEINIGAKNLPQGLYQLVVRFSDGQTSQFPVVISRD